MNILRQRLSTEIHQELAERIIKGDFPSGFKLKDSEIAEQLNVSRTPVREALLQLEHEGFISSRQHQGFSVKHMNKNEISDIYPLVCLLEKYAFEKIPDHNPLWITSMKNQADKLKDEAFDPLGRIKLDSEWHSRLLEYSGNSHLVRIISELKSIVFRYEYIFMQVPEYIEKSVSEHAAIITALENGDHALAEKKLEEHWNRSAQDTLNVFNARFPENGCRSEY